MLFILNLLFSSVSAINPSDYPAIDVVPAGNPAWTQAILKDVKVPAAIIGSCKLEDNWALTYDDGPSPFTDTALSALSSHQYKGTFFAVGSRVKQRPELLLKAYQQGHQIAIHTWSHPDLIKLTDDQIVAEIVWTARIIKDVIGVTPSVVRPPFGSVDDRVQRLLTNMGLTTVSWNRDTNDWMFAEYTPGKVMSAPFQPTDTPSAIPKLFETWVKGPKVGSISLQHDLYEIPSQQISPSLDALAKSSYKVRTVAECIDIKPYDNPLLDRISGIPPPPAPTTSLLPPKPTSTILIVTSTTAIVKPTGTVSPTTTAKPPTTTTTSARNRYETSVPISSSSKTLPALFGMYFILTSLI